MQTALLTGVIIAIIGAYLLTSRQVWKLTGKVENGLSDDVKEIKANQMVMQTKVDANHKAVMDRIDRLYDRVLE